MKIAEHGMFEHDPSDCFHCFGAVHIVAGWEVLRYCNPVTTGFLCFWHAGLCALAAAEQGCISIWASKRRCTYQQFLSPAQLVCFQCSCFSLLFSM